MKIILLLGFLLLALTGCTTEARFTIPGTLFETPEVSGKSLSGDIGIGGATAVEYVTVKNVFTTPPENSGSHIAATNPEFAFRLGLGVGNRFEISYSTPFLLGKWQFLGSNRNSARPKEWLGAVLLGSAAGANEGSGTHTEFSLLGTEGSPTLIEKNSSTLVEFEAQSVGVIIGYRFTKAMLVYGKLNTLSMESTTTIDQKVEENRNKYQYANDARQRAATLGMRWVLASQKIVGFESSLSLNSMDGAEDYTAMNFGFLIGGQWQ